MLNARSSLTSALAAIAINLLELPNAAAANAGSDHFTVTGKHSASNHAELSLPTEFWRSEFLRILEPQERQDLSGSNGDLHIISPVASIQHGVSGLAAAKLEEELFQKHSPADSNTVLTIADDDKAGTRLPYAEWERAACSAIGPQGDSTTRSGPSLITAIVGIVGIVVVGGAYFSSSRSS